MQTVNCSSGTDIKHLTPIEHLTLLLQSLKVDIKQHLGSNRVIGNIVISVPAEYGVHALAAVMKAAEKAGIDVSQIIPNLHAGSIAHSHNNDHLT